MTTDAKFSVVTTPYLYFTSVFKLLMPASLWR